MLELGEVRAHRWAARRADGELDDGRPGGSPIHGLLEAEVAEIVAIYKEWAEVGPSTPIASSPTGVPYLERVWVSPSSVRRVLAAQGLRLDPLPRPARSVRKPFLLRDPGRAETRCRHRRRHVR